VRRDAEGARGDRDRVGRDGGRRARSRIFALTVSGLFVVANVVGTFRMRRRERDQLGL
jgi:hypothetical protein